MILFVNPSSAGPVSIQSLDHYGDVMMTAMASQITGVLIVCWTVCSGADHRKHQSSASLAVVRGIHRWLVDSPHKGPVTRKMFPFNDVIVFGHHCAFICPRTIPTLGWLSAGMVIGKLQVSIIWYHFYGSPITFQITSFKIADKIYRNITVGWLGGFGKQKSHRINHQHLTCLMWRKDMLKMWNETTCIGV